MIWLIVIFGAVLRLININQSLWLDEATSVLVARGFSFSEIITRFSPGDFHPPLYYFLLKIWIGIFGATEIGARSFSVVLGSLTVFVVYLIGKKLKGEKAGLLTGFLLATAPLHIYYSQEARMYAFSAFLSSVVVLFLLLVLKKSEFKNWVGFTVSAILLLYTHYVAILLLVAIFIYLSVWERKFFKKEFGKWVTSGFIIIASFALWFPILSQQFQAAQLAKINMPSWWAILGETNLKQLALVPVKFLIGRISFYDKAIYTLYVLIPLLPSGFLLFKSWAQRKTRIIWSWLAIPFVLSAALGLFSSGFSYFRLLFILPAFYLLIAVGIFSFKNAGIQKIFIAAFILVNISSAGIYLFNPRFHREDWRGAVSWIEENSGGRNAATLFVTKGQREAYSYYAESVSSYGPEELEKPGFDTIWLMRYVQPIFDPKDTLRRKVEGTGYRKIEERDFNGVVVWEYRR